MKENRLHQLGEFIREHRQKQGLSLRRLAAATNLSAPYLLRLEQGERDQPTPDALQRIAGALEVDYADLFVLAGHPIPRDLPTLAPYLRAKFDLPDEAIDQLSDLFGQLREQYGEDEEGGGDESVS